MSVRGATTDGRLVDLYRAYGPIIYARCMKLLGESAAAEDATQETFMRVHRHLHKAPDAEQALVWIYRIATNYCLNEIRNRKHRPEPHENPPEPLGKNLEAVMGDRDLVARIVRRCPEKLRVVAWLHHVDGVEQGEVARLLGVSRRTVVNRLAEFAALAHKFVARSGA
jgi:RNA polymerase sigma-70 factor (ECF subfamily)